MANKFIFVTILLVKCNLHQSLVNRSTMRFRSTFGLFGPESPASTANASLRPPSRSPLRDLEGFKIIQSFAICPIMRFRVGARNDKEQVAPHPSPPRAGEGAITLHNLFNYATLNQLCIQAHSSSLRCGGSLCKVQGDKCGAVNYTQLILLCNYSKISSIY